MRTFLEDGRKPENPEESHVNIDLYLFIYLFKQNTTFLTHTRKCCTFMTKFDTLLRCLAHPRPAVSCEKYLVLLGGSIVLQFVYPFVHYSNEPCRAAVVAYPDAEHVSNCKTVKTPNKALPKTVGETHSLCTHLSLNSLTWHLPAKS